MVSDASLGRRLDRLGRRGERAMTPAQRHIAAHLNEVEVARGWYVAAVAVVSAMQRQNLPTDYLAGVILAVATPPDQELDVESQKQLHAEFAVCNLSASDRRRLASGELTQWSPELLRARAIASAAVAGDPAAMVLRRRAWRKVGRCWSISSTVGDLAESTYCGSMAADDFVQVPGSPNWVGAALGDEIPYVHDPGDYRKASVSYADLAAAVDRRAWESGRPPR